MFLSLFVQKNWLSRLISFNFLIQIFKELCTNWPLTTIESYTSLENLHVQTVLLDCVTQSGAAASTFPSYALGYLSCCFSHYMIRYLLSHTTGNIKMTFNATSSGWATELLSYCHRVWILQFESVDVTLQHWLCQSNLNLYTAKEWIKREALRMQSDCRSNMQTHAYTLQNVAPTQYSPWLLLKTRLITVLLLWEHNGEWTEPA